MTADPYEADKAIRSLMFADVIAVDTETTGKDKIRDGRDHLMGISCAWREGGEIKTFYFPFKHYYGQNLPMGYLDKLVFALNHQSKSLIFFNLKFDAHSFMTAGVDLRTFKSTFFDGKIELHYINENYPNSMEWAAEAFLKDSKLKALQDYANAVGWKRVSSELMDDYACHDALLTLVLHETKFWPTLVRRKMNHLMEDAIRFTFKLFSIEQRGIKVNLGFAEMMQERSEDRMKELIHEIGFDPAKRTLLEKFLLEDLGLPILKTSPKTGKPSFSRDVMEDYDDILAVSNNKIARRVLEYRGWQKANSSLYVPLQRLVSPDGLVRCNLQQTGTVTGRLSASEPNLQQIPRASENPWNGKAKNAFMASSDDYVIVGFDYSQLELRLGAHYGQDALLLDEFSRPDADPFRVLAESLFGQFTKQTRQGAKTFTYATNYGASIRKVATQLGLTIPQVESIYQNYHRDFPGLFNVSQIVESRIRDRGYIKYWSGRRRHIREAEEAYKGFNSLLQGGGAELVKLAMLQAPDNDECRQVMQIHDEITFEIRKDLVEEYTPQIIHAMTNFEYPFKVNFAVEGKEWTLAA